MQKAIAMTNCGGRGGCDYAVSRGAANCTAGGSTCSLALLVSAEQSEFHDEKLIDATRRIQEILAGLPEDPDGRTVSFLRTPFGTMLAWVKHGEEAIPEDAVTPDDDDATIAKALGIKGYAAAGAGL